MENSGSYRSKFEEVKGTFDKISKEIGEFQKKKEKGLLDTFDGISYLDAKFKILLSYCINLMFYFVLKMKEEKNIRDHPVIQRLIEQRIVVEKIRPLDEKMKFTVNKLLEIASSTDNVVAVGPVVPNLDALLDEDTSKIDPNPTKKKKKKQHEIDLDFVKKTEQAEKMEEDEELSSRRRRELERLATKLENSSLLKDMETVKDAGPMVKEIDTTGYGDLEDEDEMYRDLLDFEEDNMMRVNKFDALLKRKEKKMHGFEELDTEIDSLGKFSSLVKEANQVVRDGRMKKKKKKMVKDDSALEFAGKPININSLKLITREKNETTDEIIVKGKKGGSKTRKRFGKAKKRKFKGKNNQRRKRRKKKR